MNLSCRTVTVIIIVTCSILFTQCKKETSPDNSYGLPNATKTGAEIFACTVDGLGFYTKFIADNDLNDPNYATSGNGAWFNADTLTISGKPQLGSYFQGIQLSLIGNLQQGVTYNIDSISTIAFISSDSTCQGVSLYPVGSIAANGTIELTRFDTVNKIVSGTFNCTFPPFSICDDTVYVTNGRFDYKYH